MTTQVNTERTENTSETITIQSWFTAVAITALIWNLLGGGFCVGNDDYP
jgi:hypothetical protein